MLDDAARRGCKELLVLTGEKPEVNAEVARAPARVRPRRLHLLRRLGLRARARARAAAALEPRRARPRGARAPARGERLDGPDAGVGVRAADGDGARGLADQASGARGSRRSRPPGELQDPVHERHPGRHRRDRGGADRLARGARRGARAPRPHPGGDPPELRAAPALLRAARSPRSPTRRRAGAGRSGTATTASR